MQARSAPRLTDRKRERDVIGRLRRARQSIPAATARADHAQWQFGVLQPHVARYVREVVRRFRVRVMFTCAVPCVSA